MKGAHLKSPLLVQLLLLLLALSASFIAPAACIAPLEGTLSAAQPGGGGRSLARLNTPRPPAAAGVCMQAWVA